MGYYENREAKLLTGFAAFLQATKYLIYFIIYLLKTPKTKLYKIPVVLVMSRDDLEYQCVFQQG